MMKFNSVLSKTFSFLSCHYILNLTIFLGTEIKFIPRYYC